MCQNVVFAQTIGGNFQRFSETLPKIRQTGYIHDVHKRHGKIRTSFPDLIVNSPADRGSADSCNTVDKQYGRIRFQQLFRQFNYNRISADKGVFNRVWIRMRCFALCRGRQTGDSHILRKLVDQHFNRIMLTMRIPDDLKVHFIKPRICHIKIIRIPRHFDECIAGCSHAAL